MGSNKLYSGRKNLVDIPIYLGFRNDEFFILSGEARFTHEIEKEVVE